MAPLRLSRKGALMAESDSDPGTRIPVRSQLGWRRHLRSAPATFVVATIALLGPVAPASTPAAIAAPPGRSRIAHPRIPLAGVIAEVGNALRRWFASHLVRPAIGMTPTSRSDTPVLPTVGRPRDRPLPPA
jgi:hypothetical protein